MVLLSINASRALSPRAPPKLSASAAPIGESAPNPPAYFRRGCTLKRVFRRFQLPCRNNSLIRGTNVPALGVRAWGDITMTDSESWKERRNQVARYRVMEQETTDPLAARLLHDIVLDLEAELEGSPQSVGLVGQLAP